MDGFPIQSPRVELFIVLSVATHINDKQNSKAADLHVSFLD